jgi:hypothetical protein
MCACAMPMAAFVDRSIAVQALKGLPDWKRLPEVSRTHLLATVASAITAALKQACMELLDSVAKTQASLSKFRRATTSPAPTAEGSLTALAKIQKQLQLDVLEFGRCLEKLLGTPAAEICEFQELMQLVQEPIDGEAAPDRGTRASTRADEVVTSASIGAGAQERHAGLVAGGSEKAGQAASGGAAVAGAAIMAADARRAPASPDR